MAYLSNESGRSEIYIQGYPDKRGRWLVSASGAIGKAVWRQDGRELYWTAQDGIVMAAGIELERDGVRPGRPQPLFQLPQPGVGFQPSRDGQRFLVREPEVPESQQRSLVLIQNWAARLEK